MDLANAYREIIKSNVQFDCLAQLRKFKELSQPLGKDQVRNKEHGGPEL